MINPIYFTGWGLINLGIRIQTHLHLASKHVLQLFKLYTVGHSEADTWKKDQASQKQWDNSLEQGACGHGHWILKMQSCRCTYFFCSLVQFIAFEVCLSSKSQVKKFKICLAVSLLIELIEMTILISQIPEKTFWSELTSLIVCEA